jgi:FtsZ-binding cell division protein ZapB
MNDETLLEIQELKTKNSFLETKLNEATAHHLLLARDNGALRQQLQVAEREQASLQRRLQSISASSRFPKNRRPEELPLHISHIAQQAERNGVLVKIMAEAHEVLTAANLPRLADDIARRALALGIHVTERRNG